MKEASVSRYSSEAESHDAKASVAYLFVSCSTTDKVKLRSANQASCIQMFL